LRLCVVYRSDKARRSATKVGEEPSYAKLLTIGPKAGQSMTTFASGETALCGIKKIRRAVCLRGSIPF
jgi:hypothetical protein